MHVFASKLVDNLKVVPLHFLKGSHVSWNHPRQAIPKEHEAFDLIFVQVFVRLGLGNDLNLKDFRGVRVKGRVKHGVLENWGVVSGRRRVVQIVFVRGQRHLLYLVQIVEEGVARTELAIVLSDAVELWLCEFEVLVLSFAILLAVFDIFLGFLYFGPGVPNVLLILIHDHF